VGTFLNDTDIDGVILSNNIPAANNKTQLMVVKYSPNGSVIWVTYGVAPCIMAQNGWSTGTRIAIGEGTGQVFIAGEHAGMKLMTGLGPYPIDDLFGCSAGDTHNEPYIISLDMATGDFNNYTKILRGYVTALVVANNGIYNNELYASLYNPVDKNSFIYRVSPSTLLPSSGSYLIQTTSTGIDHIINDIKYENNKIYCVGSTEGSVQFAGMTMSVGLAPGEFTAWTAIVDDPGSLSVSAMNHGGTGGEMTGDQIYADNQDNLVIAGRYSDALLYPFNSPQAYTSLSTTSLKNAYLMKIKKSNLNSNDVIHTIETNNPSYNVTSVSLTGIENNVFISLSYTGRMLNFIPFSGSNINLGAPIYSSYSDKIAIASYKIMPSMYKEWHNTSYGLSSSDLGYENANAVYQDLIYTVGQVKERMYFNYLPTLNSTISTGPVKKALIIRNDHDWIGGDGGFKSYAGKNTLDIEEKNISIYPNPSNGNFYIDGLDKEDIVEVFDVLGKSLSFVLSFSKDKAYIEIENPASMVLVKVNGVGYQVMINE
jgi:hypothetical protein